MQKELNRQKHLKKLSLLFDCKNAFAQYASFQRNIEDIECIWEVDIIKEIDDRIEYHINKLYNPKEDEDKEHVTDFDED